MGWLHEEYGLEFPSERTENLLQDAVGQLLLLTGSTNTARAVSVVSLIAGYVMSDYSDRMQA